MVDSLYEVISPDCLCAGENYYLASPNFAWTSVKNWNLVKQLARNSMGSYLQDTRFVEMIGSIENPGIDCLATAGHELLHFVLLSIGGVNLSEQIDGVLRNNRVSLGLTPSSFSLSCLATCRQ